MQILITSAKGFVGKNLIAGLRNQGFMQLLECDIDTPADELERFARECEFVVHLAGVNRPENTDDFMKGNFGFTSVLLEKLKQYGNKSPIIITSSIQAALDNPYGQSKKAGEDLLFDYGQTNGVPVYVYHD